MALSPKMRSTLLIAVSGLTLAAVFFAPPAEVGATDTVKPVAPRARAAQTEMPRNTDVPDIVIARASDGTPLNDPFVSKAPRVEQPAAQESPAPPPEPSAPPLPYSYLGKIMEDGKVVIFLGKQDNNYSVRIGETVDGLYRLEDINDQAVTLVYLPLSKKQMLPIGRDVN